MSSRIEAMGDGDTQWLAANPRVFVSDILTGTGSEQTIEHGLHSTPVLVMIGLVDNNGGADAVITLGTHTGTALKVTCTTTAKYKIMAFGK